MLGILLCALFFGATAALSYYFAFGEAERTERRRPAPAAARPAAPAAPPRRQPGPEEAEGEENDLF